MASGAIRARTCECKQGPETQVSGPCCVVIRVRVDLSGLAGDRESDSHRPRLVRSITCCRAIVSRIAGRFSSFFADMLRLRSGECASPFLQAFGGDFHSLGDDVRLAVARRIDGGIGTHHREDLPACGAKLGEFRLNRSGFDAL